MDAPVPPPSTVKTSWVHVIWNWRISWPLYLRRSTKYEHYSEKINPMCTFMVGPISPPGIEKSAGSIIHFWIRCAFEVALLLYLEIKPMKKELDKNNNELTQLRKWPQHHGRSLAMFVYFFLNSINDFPIKTDHLLVYLSIPFWITNMPPTS